MTLHLLPNLLHPQASLQDSFPQALFSVLENLDGLIAETPTEGRRYLKKFKTKYPPYQVPIVDIKEEVNFILEPLVAGQQWGLVSDCGLPCIADPGYRIVKRAAELNIEIKAYPGPSSIMQSLMLSGLPGQHFCFHGYIAKDPQKRREELIAWEKQSLRAKETQIFIEAPHRNQHTLEALLSLLSKTTQLVVAQSLMGENALVERGRVQGWKLKELEKLPTIFLFHASN